MRKSRPLVTGGVRSIAIIESRFSTELLFLFCFVASGSLDDSLTNIQWLYHLDLPENLLGHKTPNLNAETKAKMEEGSNKKETEPSPKNPHSKPSYSYSTLILLAINSSRQKKMTLQEIYKWIEDNFPYYKKCKKAWKVSISKVQFMA